MILRKYATDIWRIPTHHFDADAARRATLGRPARPLAELLVRDSGYHRGHLKERLYADGLKQRRCELCGQGETWRGREMALILDHVNGDRRDHRIENLRIVCPNCNATLDTHCGRNRPRDTAPRPCRRCGTPFRPNRAEQRFCSRDCGQRGAPGSRKRVGPRRVDRPPYEQLLAEVAELGWRGTGRRYGVSDNAVRKWVRAYEAAQEGGDAIPAAAAAVNTPTAGTPL